MQEAEKIWMNGSLVDWHDAKVHVLSHGLHYGSSVFEGIRAYDAEGGTAVFRLHDHLERLERSAGQYFMEIPFSVDDMRQAVHSVISSNSLGACYIRPIALRGYGVMGLFPLDAPVAPYRQQHQSAHCEGGWPVPELDPRQDRDAQVGVRGGHPAQRAGHGCGRLGREHLRDQGRPHQHAARIRGDPQGHHA
jgi:hypothetical protein